jgi:hypothetical protein
VRQHYYLFPFLFSLTLLLMKSGWINDEAVVSRMWLDLGRRQQRAATDAVKKTQAEAGKAAAKAAEEARRRAPGGPR